MARHPKTLIFSAVVAAALAGYVLLTFSSRAASPVTVAFIGDQGNGDNARAVLQMIKDEGADLVLHQGDFDYKNDPDAWDRMVSDVLGESFPYFASVGNHDTGKWSGENGYQAKLKARLGRISGAVCHGDLGVRSACTYKGLFFILSGAGTIPRKVQDEPRHVAFIVDQLAKTNATWRICSWHRNQRDMQLGTKDDDVGWAPYESCRRGGAIIATGHEHSYARTHLMDQFATQSVASTSDTIVIEKGKTFAFVSGLGGRGIRSQKRDGHWWASVYTATQGAAYGALFCTFNAGGDSTRADCRFRDIKGREPDRFTLISRVKPGA